MFNIEEIASITHGKIISLNQGSTINYFFTDSRKTILRPDAAFIAFRGERHNGHEFIPELCQKGIKNFIVEEVTKNWGSWEDKVNIIKVDDSMEALQNIAKLHRQRFQIPIVAITGSNGKTIVKEWLSQILSTRYFTVKSPKSYNSQLGVPLSLLQISNEHQIAIIEAGISKKGEMARLQAMIEPDIGIFTNIGPSHDEGFQNREQKITEKWSLFAKSRLVIFRKDQKIIDQLCPRKSSQKLTWGYDPESIIRIDEVQQTVNSSVIDLFYNNRQYQFVVPFIDEASIENAMHCICAALYFQISQEDIQHQLSVIRKIEMRLELKQGVNGCYIIDDTYNNDLAGLNIAFDFMNQQQGYQRKTLILSDILQSGLPDEQLYKAVNQLIVEKKINRLIGIGHAISQQSHVFQTDSTFYKNTSEFLEHNPTQLFSDELILIKGARIFEFERIVRQLVHKIHGTVLEINLDALIHNLNFYRSKLNPNVKLMVMVKAFAYGSGSYEVASLLQFHRVDYLAVAYPDEGMRLRQQGITLPIMVMNASPESFDKIMDFKLEPEIYSLEQLTAFRHFLAVFQGSASIHIKLDTGMHRLGFEKEHLEQLCHFLLDEKHISVASIYTHLAGADESQHNAFSHQQVDLFEKMSGKIMDFLGIRPLRHVLNSAGIIRFPNYQFDMVRLGIGLYGHESNAILQKELKPISTLKTVISQIKHLSAGETVGYGRKGNIAKESSIATIAIGYADGFPRNLGNGKARVMVNGQFAPVIGNVCMDMTMINITGIEAREGDEVIIFGENPAIQELAERAGTIPYEILTNVNDRVKRVFFTQ